MNKSSNINNEIISALMSGSKEVIIGEVSDPDMIKDIINASTRHINSNQVVKSK